MKLLLIATTLLLTTAAHAAGTTFPGLKVILTEAEWKRAGLDTLTPDQIGVIDAALIRRESHETAQLQTELNNARKAASDAATAAAAEHKRGVLDRFGLPIFQGNDWRNEPGLKATVVKEEGGNSFRLDNGQVWRGDEPIVYDLVGKQIEIQPRPHGQFALYVEGQNTKQRVSRVK